MASSLNSHPNLSIHGTKTSPKGRSLHATTPIPNPGHPIAHFTTPLLTLPTQSRSSTTCHACFLPSRDSLLPCSACRAAWYCSKACQRVGWREGGHKVECRALKQLGGSGGGEMTLPTPTRALLSVVASEAKWREVNEKLVGNEDRWKKGLFADLWKDLELQGMMVRKLVGEPAWVREGGGDVVEKYASVLCKLTTNAFTVHDPDLNTDSIFVDTTLAMANHSCIPNASAQIFGKKGVLIAERPIEKDEEITISYVDLSHPTAHRKEALKTYHFDCTCPRCKDDLTVYQVCRTTPNLEANEFSIVHDVNLLRNPPIDEASITGGTRQLAQIIEAYQRLEESSSFPTSYYGPAKPLNLMRQGYAIFKPLIDKGMWSNCGPFLQDCIGYFTQREEPVERILVICLFAMRAHPYVHTNPFSPMRIKSTMLLVTCLPEATMDEAKYRKRIKALAKKTGAVGGEELLDLAEIDTVTFGRMLMFMVLEYAPKTHVEDWPFWGQVKEGYDVLRRPALWPDGETKTMIELWEKREPSEEMFMQAWKRMVGQLNLFAEMGAKLIPLAFG